MSCTSHIPIEDLKGGIITAQDVCKLKAATYYTVQRLLHAGRRQLLKVEGMDDEKVNVLTDRCYDAMQPVKFVQSSLVLKKRKLMTKITSGSKDLDNLLGEGFESGTIIEAFGESGTGKSQMAMTLSVTAQLPTEQFGGNGPVVYIDANGDFRPERVVSIAERFSMDPSVATDNILYTRVHSTTSLLSSVLEVQKLFHKKWFSAVILDGATTLFRYEFPGLSNCNERNTKMYQMLSTLKIIAEKYEMVVFITNGASVKIGEDPEGGDQIIPYGGNVMDISSTRLKLYRTGFLNHFHAKVVKSSNRESGNLDSFNITTGGVCDFPVSN